ncbi:MAG: hypothetical protein ACPGN3_15595 [Opitutales bacterium]
MDVDELKKKAVVACAVMIAGGIAFENWMKKDLEERRENIEQGISNDASHLEERWTAYVNSIDSAIQRMKDKDFEAYIEISRAYSNFEEERRRWGNTPLSSGMTLAQAHIDLETRIKPEMDKVYEIAKAAAADGSYPQRDLKSIFSQIPFTLNNNLKRRWQNDRDEVEQLRASHASNWIMVYVGGSIANAGPIEEHIRKWAKKQCGNLGPYKLVFDSPISNEEQRRVARYFNIYFEGDYVTYSFGHGSGKYGSSKIYETLRIRCENKRGQKALAKTSWDTLDEIMAHAPAPETLTFEFDRYEEDQQADFEPVIKRQKEALMKALDEALATWPALSV